MGLAAVAAKSLESDVVGEDEDDVRLYLPRRGFGKDREG
jgi:hypothetical protein